MRRLAPAVLVAALVAGACSPGEGARPASAPRFSPGQVLIDTGDDSVLVDVEIADTDAERRRGLMGRDRLAPDAGMVFLFFEPHRGGFWMKNTRIPLSIASFDVDGRILEIMDMAPCRGDPCPVYDPGVAYHGALEVNQGAFERWGVSEGDRIHLVARTG